MRRISAFLTVFLASFLIASPGLTQTEVARAGDTSFPNTFMVADSDRPGADFLSFAIPQNDANGARTCALACAENKQCQAYTYVKPGVQGPAARCYLKSSAPAPRSDSCCVSGARTPDQVVAYPAVPNPFTARASQRVGFARLGSGGVVPVAIVLIDFTGSGFPSDDTGVPFDAPYFEDMAFGPARATLAEMRRNMPVQLPSGITINGSRRTSLHSLTSFYWEASNHKLLLVPAGGIIGPNRVAPGPENDDGYTARKAAEIVAREYGERLRQFDKNGDGRLMPTEFAILVFDNGSQNAAAVRYPGAEDCVRPEGSPVELCIGVGLHGFRSTVQNPAHEFMHLLGIPYDTYGWSSVTGGGACWGDQATILSCTAFAANDENRREAVDFDAYHRMVFGWASPQLLRIGGAGVFKLKAAQSLEDRPLVLYKPDWSEIFVIEYRDGTLGGHDAGFYKGSATSPQKGVMFWYAQLGENGLVERPSGIGPDDDGFQTQPVPDDMFVDPNGDGVNDWIRPGPNATLDTTAARGDRTGYTAMIMPSKAPRTVWTGSATDEATPVGSTGIRLRDWAGNLLPNRIEIQPHPTERDAVFVFVYAAP